MGEILVLRVQGPRNTTRFLEVDGEKDIIVTEGGLVEGETETSIEHNQNL